MGPWAEDEDANEELNRIYELAVMGRDAKGRPFGWEKEEDAENRRKAGYENKTDAEWAEEKERRQIRRDREEDRLLHEIVYGKNNSIKTSRESEHGKINTTGKKVKIVIKKKNSEPS